jgi:hypothetical protein
MKVQNAFRPWGMALLILLPALPLLADDDVLRVKLEEPAKPSKNRFGVSYRAAFNVTAQFKNVGNLRGPGNSGRDPGPATGSGVDRFYDDGYNRVDISGNKDGITWFWGYKNASQVQGDSLVMHSTSAQGVRSGTWDSDIQHGFELTYNRELGHVGKKNLPWGIEAGLGWADIDIRDHRRLRGGVSTITDAYGLGGIDPNVIPVSPEFPGHAGHYGGPGPLIEDSPTRTTTFDANGSEVTGKRAFDGNLFSFRVGPYLDIPIDERWTISFSAGFAAGLIDGEYSFNQVVTTTSSGPQHQIGSGSDTKLLFGGYMSASIRCQIDEHWGVFISGQYLGLADCYSASARGQQIELDLARTALVALGVSYSF